MTNQKIQKLLTLTVILFFVACSPTKSTETNNATLSSATNPTYMQANKLLTNCNKSDSTDISLNINAVTDSSGQADPNLVKIKFNSLSTKSTASGNVVRFFKWRILAGQSSLDQTALSAQFYDLNSSQPTANLSQSIPISEITSARGIFIQLNDPAAVYQVLKTVVYDSTGQIVAQMNSLIPQFYSNPIEYKLNSDGTPRAQILLDLHPLNSVNTTAWSQTDLTNYFQTLCF